jgi:death-on-curing protein
MTRYLSAQQVLFIHARLIAEHGGETGLFSVGLLESAVARPQAAFDAAFDGVDLYSNLYEKAAALMESLAGNHPFMDGNKRVAIVAASLFLLRNGYRVVADSAELERFTWSVILTRPELGAIAGWFQAHSEAVR